MANPTDSDTTDPQSATVDSPGHRSSSGGKTASAGGKSASAGGYIEWIDFASLLAALLAAMSEIASSPSFPLGLSWRGALMLKVAFSGLCAFHAARNAPGSPLATGLFVGLFAAIFYELALLFGVLATGAIINQAFTRLLLQNMIAITVASCVAGAVASLSRRPR